MPLPGRSVWPGSCTPWCGGWCPCPWQDIGTSWCLRSLPCQSILGHQEGAKRASATVNGMLPQPNRCHKDSMPGCPGDLGSVETVDGSFAEKQMQSVRLLRAVYIFSIPGGNRRWFADIYEENPWLTTQVGVDYFWKGFWCWGAVLGFWPSCRCLRLQYWTCTETGDSGMGILEQGWYLREQVFQIGNLLSSLLVGLEESSDP